MFCSFIHDEHWKSNLIAHKNAVAASKEEEKRQENAKKKAEEDAKKKAEARHRPTSAAGQGHVVSPRNHVCNNLDHQPQIWVQSREFNAISNHLPS